MDNLNQWKLDVSRRYYFGQLSDETIAHLRESGFKFEKYKEAAFNQYFSNCFKRGREIIKDTKIKK